MQDRKRQDMQDNFVYLVHVILQAFDKLDT
jgi:hypothetical protein